jgi:hypothetical protein
VAFEISISWPFRFVKLFVKISWCLLLPTYLFIVVHLPIYCCPHTYLLLSIYLFIVVHIPIYCCPHTYLLLSTYLFIVVHIHIYCCPYTYLLLSTYLFIFVHMPIYCCPHTYFPACLTMKYTTLIINYFSRYRVRLRYLLSYRFLYWLCKTDWLKVWSTDINKISS